MAALVGRWKGGRASRVDSRMDKFHAFSVEALHLNIGVYKSQSAFGSGMVEPCPLLTSNISHVLAILFLHFCESPDFVMIKGES